MEIKSNKVKIIAISDTHGLHRELRVMPFGDVLIHCGDISNIGEKSDVIDFIDWFKSHPHPHKIFIAGNHDLIFDPKYHNGPVDKLWLKDTLQYIADSGIHYLENSGVELAGLKFWGSPITPDFFPDRWAFNSPRGEKIARYWDLIPEDTDVLITHGPPYLHLDYAIKDKNYVGCKDLKKCIDRIKPKLCLFGHIHESAGVEETNIVNYGNASLLNFDYKLAHQPLRFIL